MEITIDIETVPCQDADVRDQLAAAIQPPSNYTKAETIAAWEVEKKPALVEEAWLKTSFDGGLGHIVVAGIAFDDEEPIALYSEDWRTHERALLIDLFSLIHSRTMETTQRRPRFIGHHILGFDLRFLYQRAVVLGIPPPSIIPFFARAWDDSVFDTMLAWAGPHGTVSMDKLCRILGIPGKVGMTGADVWPAVQDGRIAEVATYCKGDVTSARSIFRRMNFQQAAG